MNNSIYRNIQHRASNEGIQVLAAALALLVLALLVALIYQAFPAGAMSAAQEQEITRLFLRPLSEFYQEDGEKYSYILALVFLPFCYLFFFFLLKKHDHKPSLDKYISPVKNWWLGAASVLFALFTGSFITSMLSRVNPFFPRHVTILLWFTVLLIWGVVLFMALKLYKFCLTSGLHIPSAPRHSPPRRLGTALIVALLLLFFASVFLIYGSRDIVDAFKFNTKHFDAVYYPIHEVVSGSVLGVDFNDLYGFYPYFFKLIFAVPGITASVESTLLILALMSCLCFAGIYFFAKKVLRNSWLPFGIMAIMLLLHVFLKENAYNITPYLQYVPIRLIFPVLFLCLSLYWFKRKSAFSTLLIWFVLALGLLWNIDSGIVCQITFLALLLYDELARSPLLSKSFFKAAAKATAGFIGSLLFALGFISLITFILSGQGLPLINMINGQRIFSGYGFYMLPMTLQHGWVAFALIYLIGLIRSITGIRLTHTPHKRAFSNNHQYFFLLSVIGLGLFLYYEGRSHFLTLAAVCWPCLILACMFMRECARTVVKRIGSRDRGPAAGILVKPQFACRYIALVVLSACLVLLPAGETIMMTWAGAQYVSGYRTAVPYQHDDEINLLRQIMRTPQTDFYHYYAAYLYSDLNISHPLRMEHPIDWLLQESADKALSKIARAQNDFYMSDEIYETLKSADHGNTLNDMLARNYDIMHLDQGIFGYVKTDIREQTP